VWQETTAYDRGKRERGGVAKRHVQELPLAQAADNLRSSSMDASLSEERVKGEVQCLAARTRVKR